MDNLVKSLGQTPAERSFACLTSAVGSALMMAIACAPGVALGVTGCGGETTSLIATVDSGAGKKDATALVTEGGPGGEEASSEGGPGGQEASSAGGDAAASFCSGTKVAGTCAATFFQSMATCFTPKGSCSYALDTSVQEQYTWTYCWTNGARLSVSGPPSGAPSNIAWSSDGAICGESYDYVAFTVGTQKLQYDSKSGDVVCPDGTKTNVGPNGSDCPALQALVSPDTKDCIESSCP